MGTVTNFKYLGVVASDDGSKPEVLSRIAQATAALTKLKPICRYNNISLDSKVKLMRSLVISIFLYACESWTLTAVREKNAGFWGEKLPEAIEHFIWGPCYQWGGSQKEPNSHWRILRTPDPGQETKAKMFWPCLKVFWFSKDNPTGHSERKQKQRQTEEEVGRQYQGVDRNGLCQLN